MQPFTYHAWADGQMGRPSNDFPPMSIGHVPGRQITTQSPRYRPPITVVNGTFYTSSITTHDSITSVSTPPLTAASLRRTQSPSEGEKIFGDAARLSTPPPFAASSDLICRPGMDSQHSLSIFMLCTSLSSCASKVRRVRRPKHQPLGLVRWICIFSC